jgi:long-chain acyl-CoA synthetase
VLVSSSDGLLTSPAALIWARRHLDLPVVIEDGGHTWTWSELAAGAALVADRLGDQAGRTVVVSARNGGAIVCGLFGVWLAGGVPAPLSPKLPSFERGRILATLDHPTVVAAADTGFLADVALDDADLLATPAVDDRPLPRLSPSSPGIVLCTSGTTGSPKAVVQTVRGVWGLVDSVAASPVDPDDLPVPTPAAPRRIEPKPMTHVGALFGMMFDLWRGRSFLVMQRFEPLQYAALVRHHGIKTVSVVPSMLRMLLDASVGELKPPAVYATTGTAALPESLRQEFEERFGIPIQLTYGQTESCGAIPSEPREDAPQGRRRPGSSGRVVAQIDVEVRDDTGAVLPIGAEGQIWIRGEVIRPTVIGDEGGRLVDGWLETGDIGRIDADRYIYLTGRQRELIVRGGLKVVPAEVESALLEHPGVAEAAVAGRPDERLGEVPVAWVRTHGAELDPEQVKAFLKQRLTAYKVPVDIHLVSEFPRTDTGKIRKNLLLEPTSSR